MTPTSPQHRTLRRVPAVLVLILLAPLGVVPFAAPAEEAVTLDDVLLQLEAYNPAARGARARQAAARSALTTARAYPNPELEGGGGASTGIGPGALSGRNEVLSIAQPLDLPFVRSARLKVAEAGIDSADESARAVWLLLRAQTRHAFYDILRRQDELAIALENERLLSTIRDKVRLRVEVGEAARYEAVKADAEWMSAIKLRESAIIRVEDAKSALHALFGTALPDPLTVRGELPPASGVPDLETLRDAVLNEHPSIHVARAEVRKSDARLRLEERLRFPQPTLKAGVERDPGLEQWRIGLSVPLPLWNQRQGPIGEARADLQNTEAQALQLELSVLRELESAYNRYRIAHRQVETFESGLLKEAEEALKVAEAAYRLGERGILDYLDAQRTYRTIRSEYLSARFDRNGAWIDLQRLTASDMKTASP